MQMHSWVRYGNVEAVKQRLERVPLDRDGREGSALLGIAAGSRLAGVDMLPLLIENGANPNGLVSQLNGTSLSIAAKSGDLDKVRFLLQAGADPHFRNANGYTPLIHAVYGRQTTRPQVIRLLLDAGADPNLVTSYNESPLGTALYFSDFETLRILLDSGADAGIMGWNPLMYALAFGTLDEVQAELQRGTDANEKPLCMTPWQLCVLVGDVAKAEKLLEHGADLNSDDLFMAVRKDNPEMVRWLLGYGADANARDSYQHSVLSDAAA